MVLVRGCCLLRWWSRVRGGTGYMLGMVPARREAVLDGNGGVALAFLSSLAPHRTVVSCGAEWGMAQWRRETDGGSVCE